MSAIDAEQLVRDTIRFTGAPEPGLLAADAPSPVMEALSGENRLYLIGLIGGKEVGKSALVNAIAGAAITQETSHGPGTEQAIAYVHRDRKDELEAMLAKDVPGAFRIVTHEQRGLAGQVLVDLPDIDSRFAAHLEVTRKLLRQMLFPMWVQSVEKYADAQPQALLARVAAGNDPANFLFCLNKADQLSASQQADLRADYAARLAKVLKLPAPPRVYLISAKNPKQFDLPELIRLLSRDRSETALQQSREIALLRRRSSLLQWIGTQDLPGRAEQLGRLRDRASEILSQRLGVPILESTIPAILDDPAYRATMFDAVFARRTQRWPIVNLMHAMFSPLRLFVRENASPGSFFSSAEALVDAHLPVSGEQSAAARVQSAFGQLRQAEPQVTPLYAPRKPWEPMDASMLAGDLRLRLIESVKRQRELVLERLSGRSGIFMPIVRVILTIGALIWFPIGQPITAILLNSKTLPSTTADIARVLVDVTSGSILLQNALFLALWYFLIWAALRWSTRRKVEAMLTRWKQAEFKQDQLNLATQALGWIDELLEPIISNQQTAQQLCDRAKALASAD